MATPRWATAAEVASVDVPPGGTTDQVLAKNSNADRDLKWADPAGGGGSFLSANTARVDPSGDDETGEVGDLNKPFLTVQGAIDAIEAMDPIPEFPVIDIGNYNFAESLTTALTTVTFLGRSSCWNMSPFLNGPLNTPFQAIEFTADTNVRVIIKDCYSTNCDIGTTEDVLTFFVQLINSSVGNIAYSGGNTLRVDGGNSSSVLQNGVSTGTTSIEISNFIIPVTVEAGDGADVTATSVILDDVTCGSLTLKSRSGAVGSISADFVSVEDIPMPNIGVPPGGTTGQALEKASNADFDTEWASLV